MSKKRPRIQGGPGLPYNWESREWRREKQEERVEFYAQLLDEPPNRSTRRALRRAELKRNYSRAQMKRSYKDKDVLERLIAFYGVTPILGEKRKAQYRLTVNGKTLRQLTARESQRVNKVLRKTKRDKDAA